ncbi:MAG: protein kinase [Polyangiaceae bacterium]
MSSRHRPTISSAEKMPTCPKCRTVYPEGVAKCGHDGETLLPDAAFAGVDPDLTPGITVGEYEIERKLGEGGFGSVYAGVHPLIGKRVAVKVLNREYSSNPQMVSRFIAEARAVNQIQHQNIIDIFAFGSLPDKRQYYVMELLEGVPFDEFIQSRGRLSPEEAIPILRQVARALDAAHAKEIVHRDLKPENIYIAFDSEGKPTPKLLDFGIAKLLGDTTSGHKTNTGAPIGTPYYMSPEQCRGTGVDHRTDIYSFGVMCFEVLSGQRPFVSDQMLTLMLKHINEPAPALSAVCGLPAELDAPIQRMMAKDAADRPQTVSMALEELAAAAQGAGLSVTVSPLSGGGHAMPTPRLGELSRTELDTEQMSPSIQHHLQKAAGASTQAPLAVDTGSPKKSSRLALFAAAGVLLLGGIGAGVFLLRSGAPAVTPDHLAETASPPTSSSPAAPPASASEDRAASTGAPPSAEAPVAPQPTSVRFTIDSKPKDVEAFLEGKKVGSTADGVELPFGDEEVEVEFQAPGYLAKKVHVKPKAGGVIAVSLVKIVQRVPVKKKANGGGDLENPF